MISTFKGNMHKHKRKYPIIGFWLSFIRKRPNEYYFLKLLCQKYKNINCAIRELKRTIKFKIQCGILIYFHQAASQFSEIFFINFLTYFEKVQVAGGEYFNQRDALNFTTLGQPLMG